MSPEELDAIEKAREEATRGPRMEYWRFVFLIDHVTNFHNELAVEAKRARASESRLSEALKGVLFMLDMDMHEVTPEMKDRHNIGACCVCVANAALKGAAEERWEDE